MTDNERLNKLITKYKNKSGVIVLDDVEFNFLVRYAKKQTEQVEKLEEENNNLHKRLQKNGVKYNRQTQHLNQIHKNRINDSVENENKMYKEWREMKIELGKAEQQNNRYRESIEIAFNEIKHGDAYNAELVLVEALECESDV